MYSPFPTEAAYHYCLVLKGLLDKGFLGLEQVTRLSAERAGQGVMLGCLVSADAEGNRIVLCACSGISKKIIVKENPDSSEWELNGEKYIIVSPVVSAEEIDKALKKNDEEIHSLTDQIKKGNPDVNNLKERRKLLCDESLEEVRKLYNFKSLYNPFSLAGSFLPTGTGDCCEPKLINYALEQNLKPVSLAQIFYGETGSGLSRRVGCGEDASLKRLSPGERLLPLLPEIVPPCDERCGFLLPKMLGLEVLYVDRHIVVVNKPSGLLSVPGRGEEKQDCVVNRVKKLYGELCKISQPSVHRLDMETSGILILAFTEEAHRNLSSQFEAGSIHKEYVALLEGVLEKQGTGEGAPKRGEKSGMMKLKFRLDPENRPHQVYDEVHGKEGITRWQNEGLVWYTAPDGEKIKATKIRFFPETGRTHQLRLASAECHGFGLPIIGDSLYGKCAEGQRLMLHAEKITFRHPVNGRELTFVKPSDF